MPTFDAATSTTSNASVTSVSLSHTASGSNRYAKLASQWFGDQDCTSMTYAGGGGTPAQLWAQAHGGDSRKRTAVFGAIAPATGSQTCQANYAAAVTDISFGVSSYTDVHQTTATGTAATAEGSSTAPSVSVSAAVGELVVDFCGAWFPANNSTADGSQTVEWEANHWGLNDAASWASYEAGAASVTMSGTLANSAAWAIGGVALKPAAAGGTSLAARLSLLGVGI